MIKTIFFDFDGVLTTDKAGSQTTCKNIHKLIPDVPFDHILQCYRKRKDEFLLGKINHSALWSDFCDCIGKKLNITVLEKAFRDTPQNEDMIQLAQNLKKRYRLGIITDNNKERFTIIAESMHLSDMFDYLILSADIGAMKDEELIFRKALEAANCEPQECVFIDNDADNLIVPSQLGMKTIFHDHEKNDVKALEKRLIEFGVLLNPLFSI